MDFIAGLVSDLCQEIGPYWFAIGALLAGCGIVLSRWLKRDYRFDLGPRWELACAVVALVCLIGFYVSANAAT